MCKMMSVPRVFFFADAMEYSVEPSQIQRAASEPSWYDLEMISTSLATIKAE